MAEGIENAAPQEEATEGGGNNATTPRSNSKNSATSVALTASFNFSDSRKYNFDVTGAASIEATLKSVPPPPGLVEFLQQATKSNT